MSRGVVGLRRKMMSNILWTCFDILCVGVTVTISIMLIGIAVSFTAHITKDTIKNWRNK